MSTPPTPKHPVEHPAAALSGLVENTASRAEQQRAVRHLIAGCSSCAAELKDRLHPPRVPRHEVEGTVGRAVDDALGKAEEWVVAVRQEKEDAQQLVETLLALPAPHQALKITNLRRTHRQGVCEVLIEHARAERHTSVSESLRFARLATVVADRLESNGHGETRARAWAEFGNALRLSGDHRASRRAFGKAERFVRDECADPLVAAEVASLRATLEGMDKNPARAAELLEGAARQQIRFSDLAGTAQTLLKLSRLYGSELADPDRGMRTAAAALELSEEVGDRNLKLIAVQHLIHFLSSAGRPAEALALLMQAEPVFAWGAPLLQRLRLHWLGGRLQMEVGDHRAAAESFQQVQESFLEQELPFEVALVSLDLTVAWAHLGQRSQLRRLVGETATLLSSLGLSQENLAAVHLMAQAEAAEICTAASQIAAAVERLQSQKNRPAGA